jgi:hypothetical protein
MKKSNLISGKHQVEKLGNNYMSRQFYHWKHYISIYSRYKDAIKEAFEFAGDGNSILHLDADLYINNNIESIFNTIKKADVSILLRPSYAPEWRKTYGCILGFTVNNKSRKFMERVRQHILKPKFKDIPKGYGQIVFWRAYNEFKDYKQYGIKFAQIPKTWIYKGFNNRALILSANNGLKKKETADRYTKLARNERVDDVERNSQRAVARRQTRQRFIHQPRRQTKIRGRKSMSPVEKTKLVRVADKERE